MLEEILHHGGLGKYPDDQLATLQNLLAAAADGVHVLVGTYPHAGEAEGVSATATHPADVIALATGGERQRPDNMQRGDRSPSMSTAPNGNCDSCSPS